MYQVTLERFDLTYAELEPLYREHYRQMQERLRDDGVSLPDFNPRLDEYFECARDGWFLNFVVRKSGEPVGYCNIYVTNDMHNGEKIAVEDTIYIKPGHRCGIGKKLVQHVLKYLKTLDVKRVQIKPATDLRVAKIWRRMGFKDMAQVMSYDMEDA